MFGSAFFFSRRTTRFLETPVPAWRPATDDDKSVTIVWETLDDAAPLFVYGSLDGLLVASCNSSALSPLSCEATLPRVGFEPEEQMTEKIPRDKRGGNVISASDRI